MRQMTEVSFESGQQAGVPAGNMANPLCPPEQANSGQQKCEDAKTIQIRLGETKDTANRKKRGNKRERRETREKMNKKMGERKIQQRKKEKENVVE